MTNPPLVTLTQIQNYGGRGILRLLFRQPGQRRMQLF